MGFIVGERVSDVLTLLLSQVGVNPSMPKAKGSRTKPVFGITGGMAIFRQLRKNPYPGIPIPKEAKPECATLQ